METIENGFEGWVRDGIPASSLFTLAIVFKVTLGLLKWLKMVPFTAYMYVYIRLWGIKLVGVPQPKPLHGFSPNCLP